MSSAVACSQPEYPRHALRMHEEGVSVLGFLVNAEGAATRSVVLSSSGSTALDDAARDALGSCTFKPATVGGKPVETWVEMIYTWYTEDDPDLQRPKGVAAAAAAEDNLDARFQLSFLLLATAKPGTEAREQGLTVLRGAAERGHAHAQFMLGRRYEKGSEVKLDPEDAMRWYRKAAAQGDPFAIQRLERGALP